MIFGYFEFLILILLIAFNFFQKKKSSNVITYLILILLFGLILPTIAAKIEIELLISKGLEHDGMNFLWIVFKFPIYWAMGFFESVFLAIKKNKPFP